MRWAAPGVFVYLSMCVCVSADLMLSCSVGHHFSLIKPHLSANRGALSCCSVEAVVDGGDDPIKTYQNQNQRNHFIVHV